VIVKLFRGEGELVTYLTAGDDLPHAPICWAGRVFVPAGAFESRMPGEGIVAVYRETDKPMSNATIIIDHHTPRRTP
jgi:hypothetical protein